MATMRATAPGSADAGPRARLRVVVAGAGFAGMNVAKALEGACDVTLVAPTDRFVYLPLIHEVLSETTQPDQVTRRLSEVLPRTELVHGRAERVEGNELVTAAGERLPFDRLVVAVGAETRDFGIPGVREHALPFYSVGDALRANATVKVAVARAHDQASAVRVIVVGAGATGIEVAGETADLLKTLSAPHEIRVVDALPGIFPNQSEEFRAGIREGLSRLDIQLLSATKVTQVRADHLLIEGDDAAQHLDADVIFWAAGVKPRTVEGVDPRVRPTLQSAGRDDVFLVGDAAQFPKQMGVPKLAQTAEDQAKVAAHNILNRLRMQEYTPRVKGIIVSVGEKYAVAELTAGPVLTGTLPWHVKRMLYKAKIALA